jgi:endonuclease/exonuclease/phosphatase family metal-dependent hydrolase
MRCCLVLALAACTKTAPVAITSLASTPRAEPVPVATPEALRVMSYNLNFGVAGDPDGAAAIAQGAADIVMLQEANEAWEVALVAALPQYAHHRFAPPIDWPAGGMGMLSRFPIRSIETLPAGEGGLFFAWRAVVDAPRGPIQILNVHLRPPVTDGGSWVLGFFTTRGIREHELAWHLARLDPALPTLVVGDFNEEASSGAALATAARAGFTDAIAQHAGRTRTWEWQVGMMTLRFQLDHVLYDRHFVAPRAGIVEAGRSDHKPVWADVERVD